MMRLEVADMEVSLDSDAWAAENPGSSLLSDLSALREQSGEDWKQALQWIQVNLRLELGTVFVFPCLV